MSMINYTRACLNHNNVSIFTTYRLWTTILLGLAPHISQFSTPCDLAHMQMTVTIN
jgi:hypothetical protein